MNPANRSLLGAAAAGAGVAEARQLIEHSARLWTAIGAPYEAARARLELARAQAREGHEMLAERERSAAQALFERAGAQALGEHAASAPPEGATSQDPSRAAPDAASSLFHLEGDVWLVAFSGRSVRLKDRKGLRYLARLLSEPGREHHVLALVADEREDDRASDGGATTQEQARAASLGDAGSLLDAKAKETYRRRLSEIDTDLAEAESSGDAGRAQQARREREFLARELARAVGLGGRDRHAGVASERARVSITRAIRQALAVLREHHVPLAAHLERAIRTGTYCAYLPDPQAGVRWSVTTG
ncbi:MAG TPA: hypothetical protein VFS67_15385 [Polyangiaceae bacterium]|nr:hypothetical protein [Polyangiaceae bacterium]